MPIVGSRMVDHDTTDKGLPSLETSMDVMIDELMHKREVLVLIRDRLPEIGRALAYANTRAVSRVAYPHACEEEKKMRDLIDAGLETYAVIARAMGCIPEQPQ